MNKITRTITRFKVNVSVINPDTLEIENGTVGVKRNTSVDIKKAVAAKYPGYIYLRTELAEEVSTRYAMSEEDFIKNAEIIG